MKKIIIKYKLKNRDDFEKRVEQEGFDFMPPFWQHERVYVPKNYRKNNSYPRLILRTEMKAVDRPAKYELELRRHIKDSGIDIVETTLIRKLKCRPRKTPRRHANLPWVNLPRMNPPGWLPAWRPTSARDRPAPRRKTPH